MVISNFNYKEVTNMKFINKNISPISILKTFNISLVVLFISHICFLALNYEKISLREDITLFIPIPFYILSIVFSCCFLKTGKTITYYLFIIFMTALCLSFIEIHTQTEKMAETLNNISSCLLFMIKTLSILISLTTIFIGLFSKKIINLFNDNEKH